MTDIAALGVKLDTSQVKQGQDDLDRFAGSARGVEAAATGMAAHFRSAGLGARCLAVLSGAWRCAWPLWRGLLALLPLLWAGWLRWSVALQCCLQGTGARASNL